MRCIFIWEAAENVDEKKQKQTKIMFSFVGKEKNGYRWRSFMEGKSCVISLATIQTTYWDNLCKRGFIRIVSVRCKERKTRKFRHWTRAFGAALV